MIIELTPGTQVYYVPDHADDLDHPDVEQGFISAISMKEDSVWVRYFYRQPSSLLRTTANSELTPVRNLVVKDHRDQGEIDTLMKELGYS